MLNGVKTSTDQYAASQMQYTMPPYTIKNVMDEQKKTNNKTIKAGVSRKTIKHIMMNAPKCGMSQGIGLKKYT